MPVQTRVQTWQIGAWQADPSDDRLTRAGESIKLEPRMMRLLLCLARSADQVLSQEQLLKEVWPGLIVGPASVYQSISQLRKVLGDTDSPPTYIETVSRKGYRLIAPVRAPEEQVGALTSDGTAAAEQTRSPESAQRARSRWRWAAATTLAVVLAVTAFLVQRLTRTPEASGPSIVVMPLVDMTAQRTEQPFCDGLTEELSNWLAQIPTLRVVGRTSAFALRDQANDVREIGRRLGTTHLLEGSLRKSGNHARITVQLVSTHDGYHVWSDSYDTELTDVIRVQEQIARSVAQSLDLRMTQATAEQLADRRSASAQAYSLYLIARYHQLRITKSDTEQAIQLYKQALALDPDFALAQVYLAYAYMNERYLSDRPIQSIAPEAQALLARALQRAPRLADLYAVRGALATELLQSDAALRDLQHALALNPNLRTAVSELGFHYLVSGSPRVASVYLGRAVELDPLEPDSHAQRCIALSDLAQYDAAAAACERGRSLGPSNPYVYTATSELEDARGHVVEALSWNAAALERSPDVQDLYASRGRWLLELGLIQRAAETYDRAVKATTSATELNSDLASFALLARYAQGGLKAMRELMSEMRLTTTTDPNLLFVAAHAELVAGQPDAARAFIERAAGAPALQADDLASAWNARFGRSDLLTVAAVEQATGASARAAQHLNQLALSLQRFTAAGMRRHGLYLLNAQLAALRGDADTAMESLQQAALLGWYGLWSAEHDPYFKALRQRADFHALLERIRAQNAEAVRRLPAADPAARASLPAFDAAGARPALSRPAA
jgi:TolB-like protein/DNA-binding winged helix-turn-helix (wHTH) protein/Tfp pilus assembly protein PilF